jgi:RNA-directed DNA polymerase
MAFAIESSNERVDASPSAPFPPIKWKDIDWKVVEKHVERLKDRIYKAIDEGDFRKVKNLQKLAINSFHVKLHAIRHVTVTSTGRNTPGIDGKLYTTDEKREELCERVIALDLNSYHPKPAKRVEIPKANGKMRPLGIPTIFDRVVQTIVKTAMEPEWEYTPKFGV